MPTSLQDIEEQAKLVKRAGAKSTHLAGVGSEFIGKVKEELRKRAQDKGVTQLGQAAASARREFATAPAQIREEYKDIDPFKRMGLEAQRRGDIMAELTEIMDLKSQRETGVMDILGMARGGIEAESERAMARAKIEQQAYTNMFDQLKFQQETLEANAYQKYQQGMLEVSQGNMEVGQRTIAEAERSAAEAERVAQELREWEQPMLEEKHRYEMGQPYSTAGGGGNDLTALAALLEGLGLGSQEEPSLTPTPVAGQTYSLSPLMAPNGDIIGADNEEEYRSLIQQGYRPYFGR